MLFIKLYANKQVRCDKGQQRPTLMANLTAQRFHRYCMPPIRSFFDFAYHFKSQLFE